VLQDIRHVDKVHQVLGRVIILKVAWLLLVCGHSCLGIFGQTWLWS
jgi:hypothetical protein